jgi:hypothetical protein
MSRAGGSVVTIPLSSGKVVPQINVVSNSKSKLRRWVRDFTGFARWIELLYARRLRVAILYQGTQFE